MELSPKDHAMVMLYMAGCVHDWERLPELARRYLEQGATAAELRGCVRHLVVFAGYGPCLAATLALHKARVLPEDTPAKVSGPPGDAFELVYAGVADRVRANMHAADPALGEWIRLHLYGDVYSSPGLNLRQKQLLACAFLSRARMPDQLFGHALAALRFGNTYVAVQAAARLACDLGTPAAGDLPLKTALTTIELAHAKYCKEAGGRAPACPEVTVDDAEQHVRIPPLPACVDSTQRDVAAQQRGQQGQAQPALDTSAGSDANVTVGAGVKPSLEQAASRPANCWGSSHVDKPSNLEVGAIAARLEAQRVRSGLFMSWAQEVGGEPGRADGEEEAGG